MRYLGVGMATQLHPRIAKRMPCSIAAGDQRHTGLVLNVSQGGLFVQTNATLPAGENLDLALTPPDTGSAIPLQGTVIWKRVVPSQLRTSAMGGLGVRIEQADETYFRMLAEWMRVEEDVKSSRMESSLAPNAQDLIEDPNYSVRVLLSGHTRSRRLEVVAESADAAKDAALDRMGKGWRIIEVKDLRKGGRRPK